MNIDGRFWFTKDGESFLGRGRIELLEKIAETGSILAAAKAMKMSYKAAWERIEAMNRLSLHPLIERTTGGRGGGGTTLTPYAHELIATFKRFEQLHRQFIDRFAEAGDDPERLARILGRTFLTTSARNQVATNIIDVEQHGLHTTLTLALDSDTLRATITTKSAHNMGLIVGCDVYAIIKSNDISIVSVLPCFNTPENIVEGTIESLETYEENTEVALRLKDGTLLISLEKYDAIEDLQIGMKAYAVISPLHIIIGL